jgi:4-amino-4-deoxy-L-arabinose transferase-like glycosyltransferase
VFFLKKQPALLLLIASLMLAASFLRLWNLPYTLMFQGDQGRDALIVSEMFTKGDLVFIGPVTSVGNMYLGPLYYYFMLPFLRLSYPSPLGPAYAVAALGILTVYLLYRWGQQLVGTRAAVIATILGTFSVSAVTYSRFSWNPNPAPLVGLIMMYATYKAWKSHPRWWVLVALCFSVLIQLHYLALLSLGGAGVIWLIQARELWLNRQHTKSTPHTLKNLLSASVVAALLFGMSLTPLILFDFKHDGLNAKALQKLVFQEESFADNNQLSLAKKVPDTMNEMHGRSMHILFEHTVGKNRTVNTALLVVTALLILPWLFKTKRPTWAGEVVIVSYLVTGIVGSAVYEHSVFDHYIAYLFPASFLIQGLGLARLSRHLLGSLAVVAFVGYFLWHNLARMPLQPNGWTIYDMQRVTDSIYQRLGPDEKYSLVLLSPSKDLYGQNYRYFLSTTNKPPLPPERAGEADTLVIINEEHVTNVSALPIYEITIFPQKTTSETYTIDTGPEIIMFRK